MTPKHAEKFAASQIAAGAATKPFLLGWLHGYRGVARDTPRAAEHLARHICAFPSADWTDRYLNGADDGKARDTTRISLAAQTPA